MDLDGFRYRFQPASAPGEDLVYVPYWRFKGMLFTCTTAGVMPKFVDVSLQATPSRHLPVTLGLRSQALKLSYVTPDTPGRFIAPELSRRDMLKAVGERFPGGSGTAALHQCEIGESASLVYAPYRIRDRIIDGILETPITGPLSDGELEAFAGGPPTAGVRILPTLCPRCGWDMVGHKDAHLMTCRNCESVWVPDPEGFKRMGAAVMGTGDNDAYLPFWRIQAEVEGLPLSSYEDLSIAANLPRAPQDDWKDRPFRFWSPAFKIRPGAFLQIMRTVTLGQPDGPTTRRLPNRSPVSANLPYREALETITMNIAAWLTPPKRYASELPRIRIRPKKIRLVYLPFSDGHHEFVMDSLSLAVRKSHLLTAGNL
jgi:hypothetical protein